MHLPYSIIHLLLRGTYYSMLPYCQAVLLVGLDTFPFVLLAIY
jgi:hypothetical protein